MEILSNEKIQVQELELEKNTILIKIYLIHLQVVSINLKPSLIKIRSDTKDTA
jgi:hypothetical protein